MADLPDIVPLFPLPNLVLFPGTTVPLHIFEPRYREMITDAAASHGIIGMVMLRGVWEREYYAEPRNYSQTDIFGVGCAGRVTALERLPDGRFNLHLRGLREFRIRREIRERAYRQAEVDWCASPELQMSPHEMAALHDLLTRSLGANAEQAWSALVEGQGLRDADLVNFLCFHLDIAPIEKQTLLEALEARTSCLLDVLTFKSEERKFGPGGSGNSTVN